MLWSSLCGKLGRQSLRNTQHTHVHVMLPDPETGELKPVYLDLKFDRNTRPYFVISEKQNRQEPV